MINFSELITYQADEISTVLISDLHLNPFEPAPNRLEQAFLALLDKLIVLPHLKQLFILGDWFEAWLGDDVAETELLRNWFEPMINRLQQLNHNGCQIYVMHGNRDFLIGQKFCDKFGGKLIKEPFYFRLDNKTIRLEHGDALCTDDKKYQRFRKIIQNPLTKRLLLTLPIKKREQIAHNLRQKSKTDNAKKSLQIMDVNTFAVERTLQNCDILLHGHTHRPAVHAINDKQRIVLGDWRIKDNQLVAEIGVVADGKLALVSFTAT